MADGVRVEADAYRRIVRDLRHLGPDLQKSYSARMREAAKPFSRDVLITGAAGLPKRGGLSYRVASSRAQIFADNLRVTVVVGGKYADGLGRVDEGIIRHPIFGRTNAGGKREMADQRVRPHLFREPFQAGAPKIRAALLRAGQEALNQAAR
jgi:hypothetical protein